MRSNPRLKMGPGSAALKWIHSPLRMDPLMRSGSRSVAEVLAPLPVVVFPAPRWADHVDQFLAGTWIGFSAAGSRTPPDVTSDRRARSRSSEPKMSAVDAEPEHTARNAPLLSVCRGMGPRRKNPPPRVPRPDSR